LLANRPGDLMSPAIRRDKRKRQIPMHPKNFRKRPVLSPGTLTFD
jgi:hypothetical protein